MRSCHALTCALLVQQLMTEKNLENVSHEEAVAALKCTSDRVVLVVAKSDSVLQAAPPLSQSSINLTTHHVPLPASPTPPPPPRKCQRLSESLSSHGFLVYFTG